MLAEGLVRRPGVDDRFAARAIAGLVPDRAIGSHYASDLTGNATFIGRDPFAIDRAALAEAGT